MNNIEDLALWLLEQGSVCINDDYPSPVTISFETGWIEVPLEFHSTVKYLKKLAELGE